MVQGSTSVFRWFTSFQIFSWAGSRMKSFSACHRLLKFVEANINVIARSNCLIHARSFWLEKLIDSPYTWRNSFKDLSSSQANKLVILASEMEEMTIRTIPVSVTLVAICLTPPVNLNSRRAIIVKALHPTWPKLYSTQEIRPRSRKCMLKLWLTFTQTSWPGAIKVSYVSWSTNRQTLKSRETKPSRSYRMNVPKWWPLLSKPYQSSTSVSTLCVSFTSSRDLS